MAYQHPPPHARNRGTTRDTHGRGYVDSQPGTRSANESSTRHQATARSANSPRRRTAGVDEQRHGHTSRRADEPEYDYHLTHDRYDHCDTRETPLSYDRVPRSHQSENPRVQRILQDPILEDAIVRLGSRSYPRNRSVSRQSRPTPTQNHRPRARSPDWYHRNSRPLGMSNLNHLNETRSQIHPMERRFREDRRDGAYDAVEYVERPQYVYEEEYQQQQEYQYEYDEYYD